MQKFLKNYTSAVPVLQTIHRIEEVLIKCGVSGITKEYIGTNGEIAAIMFHLELPGQPSATVRLAPKTDEAQEVLWRDYAGDDDLAADGQSLRWSRKRQQKSDFRRQAERTAWKLLQDRIEVEMSLIQLKQRDFVQAFMADVWDGSATVYDRLLPRLTQIGFRALLPEKTQ